MVYSVNNWMVGMGLVLVSILLCFFVAGRRPVRPVPQIDEPEDAPDTVPESEPATQSEIVPIGALGEQ